MTKQIAILIVILPGLFLSLSCEKEVPLAPAKPVTLETFPNTLGSQWTYHMIDNLQIIDSTKPDIKFDIVPASIESIIEPATGEEVTFWRYLISQRPAVDRPIVFKGDTVHIFWHGENRSSIGLVFPFKDKDRWRTGGILSGDETFVKEVITVRVTAGLFENVFVLENKTRAVVSTDSKRTITLWYVPNLGPIKIHVHEEHLQAVGDTTWTLVDHNFPGFD